MTVITMSRNELTRLRVLIDIADGRLSIADATGLIGAQDMAAYSSGLRGRNGSNSASAVVRASSGALMVSHTSSACSRISNVSNAQHARSLPIIEPAAA